MESSEFDGAFKAQAPRRAAPRRRPAEDEADADAPTVVSPIPGKAAKSGWGDSESGAGAGWAARKPIGRRGGAAPAAVTEGAVESRSTAMEDDDAEGGPIIPDLEDESTNVAMQVAQTAEYQRTVPSIKELDALIHMSLPPVAEAGVDLTILHSYLAPAAFVKEDDTTWEISWELLQIASEIAREEAALSEKEGSTPAAKAAAKVERVRDRGAPKPPRE